MSKPLAIKKHRLIYSDGVFRYLNALHIIITLPEGKYENDGDVMLNISLYRLTNLDKFFLLSTIFLKI